jgi:hypothetical protein
MIWLKLKTLEKLFSRSGTFFKKNLIIGGNIILAPGTKLPERL